MQHVTIDLQQGTPANLTCYLHQPNPAFVRQVRPAIIICPGGGYQFVSAREAEPIAIKYYAEGYQAFVLNYTVRVDQDQPVLGLQPLKEASAAIALVRANHAQWQIDPHAIAIAGFSAGGHLAASTGTLFNHPALADHAQAGANRPDAMVLCYPVISSGPYAHRGSFDNLATGEQAQAAFSLEHQITDNTPPVFLWHTVADDLVPVENALLFASGLQQHHIPFECHLYNHGGHGLSLATRETNSSDPHIAGWFDLSVSWLNKLFNF